MSTQDEDDSSKTNGYQFFTHDLYSSYFGDQNSTAASTDLSAFTSSFSAADYTTSLTVPVPNLADLLPAQASSTPGSLETTFAFAAPVLPQQAPVAETPVVQAPVVEAPSRPAYSLKDDTPEPTFEERVAAMNKAAEPASPANNAATEDRWRPYQQHQALPSQEAPAQSPQSDLDTFSADFDFNRSLLKIFWRIDIDHNNRVSKKELAQALDQNWFSGDEKVLAKILFYSYEDITSEAIFCDAGLSVNNILSYAPFSDFANSASSWERPESVDPAVKQSANQPKKTTSQLLRWNKTRGH